MNAHREPGSDPGEFDRRAQERFLQVLAVRCVVAAVALGILEKEKNIRMTFFRWFWVGLAVGLVTTAIVWAALLVLPMYR